MYLQDRAVYHGDHRVADRGEKIGDCFQVKGGKVCLFALQLQKQFGAVAVGHFALAVKHGGARRCRLHAARTVVGICNALAAQHAVEPLHDVEQSGAAAVDDACLFQHSEKFRRALQRRIHFFGQIGKQGSDGALPGNAGDGVFHCLACNGENCALRRGQHGAIRLLHRSFQCGSDCAAICLFTAVKPLCHAAEKLRQDDAGVAARAEQHAVRQRLHHLGQIAGFHAVERGDAALNRAEHVDTCVAVRDGKHVEPVDFFRFVFQYGSAAVRHSGQQRAVQICGRFCGGRCLHFVILHESYSL